MRYLPFAALLALASLGCQTRTTTATFSRVASASASVSASSDGSAAGDYRKLSKAELEKLLMDKCGYTQVTVSEQAPGRYSGKCTTPDGTELPFTISVEEQKITAESRTPAGFARNVITPQGVESSMIVN